MLGMEVIQPGPVTTTAVRSESEEAVFSLVLLSLLYRGRRVLAFLQRVLHEVVKPIFGGPTAQLARQGANGHDGNSTPFRGRCRHWANVALR